MLSRVQVSDGVTHFLKSKRRGGYPSPGNFLAGGLGVDPPYLSIFFQDPAAYPAPPATVPVVTIPDRVPATGVSVGEHLLPDHRDGAGA
jgi:hypothetical protein